MHKRQASDLCGGAKKYQTKLTLDCLEQSKLEGVLTVNKSLVNLTRTETNSTKADITADASIRLEDNLSSTKGGGLINSNIVHHIPTARQQGQSKILKSQ